MQQIKVCSLFSGVGGFETGLLKELGGNKLNVVFASEIDPYASAAYTELYGEKPNGDITKINEKDIPDHDLLVGGFPCQSFSLAGRRRGFEDTRGTLFFDIVRIAKEKQPNVLLLENVKGLLTHDKGKTFEVIIQTLGEIGYKVDFQIMNSKHFNVAQNRERIYLVAVRNVVEEAWDLQGVKGIIHRTKKKLLAIPGIQTFNFSFPPKNRASSRLMDILEEEVADNYFLDSEIEAKIISKLKQIEIEKVKVKEKENRKVAEVKLQFVAGVTDTPNWLDNGKELSRNYKQGSRIYNAEGLSTTLSAEGVGGLGGHSGLYLVSGERIRRLTPLECFRLQSFPDTYITQLKKVGFSNARLYKMAGNAVTVNVVAALTKELKHFL